MGRIASPSRFRAEGAVLHWPEIARMHLEKLDHVEVDKGYYERLEQRGIEVHLRWACSGTLGAPPGPFTVWARPHKPRRNEIDVTMRRHPAGISIGWGGTTVQTIEVEFDVSDPGRAVALWGFRGPPSAFGAVAVEARHPTGPGRMSLVLRISGMTGALLVNGHAPVASVEYLRDVLEDPNWREIEIVGLPIDAGGWAGTDYAPGPQGPVASLLDPIDAAIGHLDRGGPPIGWWPATETGRAAPPWASPDHGLLVEEVRRELMPEIEVLYSGGLAPFKQAGLRTPRDLPPPEQEGRTSTATSSAELPPFGALMLAATTDPFLALATGFGTAYPAEQRESDLWGSDFLITADYPETPEGEPATYAALVPWPERHRAMAPVTGLLAARDGLVRPATRDDPWRETVKARWDHVDASAALGRPSGVGFGRFDPAASSPAECLLTERDSGGWRTLIPTREPPTPPGLKRVSAVDPAQEIPIGSGSRSVGYAVAVHDVFGVWSRWEDAEHLGTEPEAPSPRILSVRLDTRHEGSASCPATVEVHFALDWSDRTPKWVDLYGLLFPAATVTVAPPISDPSLPTPPDCLRSDVRIEFAGHVPTVPAGVRIRVLDVAGETEVAPGAPQSEEARRYAVTYPVPNLDFSSTRHWGLALWGQEQAVVLGGPGPLAPSNGPATAFAASPVPPQLPAPSPLPGVPVGSAPDSQGCSHVKVSWSPPGGDVARFVVWEVAETALRSAAGLTPRAAEGIVPGERLLELRTAYAGLGATQRRALFRRVREVPSPASELDVALAPGSTDIHLFAVTAVGSGNVESGWPDDPLHLRAFMAPVLKSPAAPALSPSFVKVGGVVQLKLDVSTTSEVAVEHFLLFKTRSEGAARSAETMGPHFAAAAASVTPDPATPTGRRVYTGSWTGPVPEGWEPTRFRAVAIPVAEVPVEAVRGVPSPGSPQVPIQVPPSSPPNLEPATADDWGSGGTGVVIRTGTTAPVAPTPLGPHVLRATIESAGSVLFAPGATGLHEAPVSGDPAAPPAGADAGPVFVVGPRSGGRSPLALWFTRPSSSDPVSVTIRLADPTGKVTERSIDVPAGPLGDPPSLEIIDFFRIVGRGVVFRFRSDAPVEVTPAPYLLHVTAASARSSPWPPWRSRFEPGGGRFPRRGGGPDLGDLLRPRPVTLSVPLPEIPTSERSTPFPTRDRIVVVRSTDSLPYEYEMLVRLQPPLEVTIAVESPDGLRTTRSAHVGK